MDKYSKYYTEVSDYITAPLNDDQQGSLISDCFRISAEER